MATGTRRWTDKFKWIAAGNGCIEAGTSEVPLNIKTASVPLIKLHTTSALTAGDTQSMEIKQVRSATTVGGNDQPLKVTLSSEYKTPGAASAIYGIVDYGDTGCAHGMASAICAEMILPNMSLTRGGLYCLELELGGGASSSFASAGPVAFIYCGGWGAGTLTEMDARGFLFNFVGFTEGNDKLFDNGGTPAAADGGIRIKIGANTRYLLYANDAET